VASNILLLYRTPWIARRSGFINIDKKMRIEEKYCMELNWFDTG
jgi:hypothetical protein